MERSQFEAIVAPDDPFSHLTSSDDRDRALCSVVQHLAPDGVFVLDAGVAVKGLAHGCVLLVDAMALYIIFGPAAESARALFTPR